MANKTKHTFRPTAMSLVMARAGVIPGLHMVKDDANITLLVRQRNDTKNERPSIKVPFSPSCGVPGAFGKEAVA